MKKKLLVVLALMMCLSLCACGDATPSEETTVKTQGETTVKTLEELKAEARYLSDIPELANWVKSRKTSHFYGSSPYLEICALYEKWEENPLIFKNTYIGEPYYVTGYVTSMTQEDMNIGVEKNAGSVFDVSIVVHLANKGDLLTVKKGEVVTVVGIFSEWPGGIYCYLDSAYIVERNGK